jgi:hypothetical protein
LRQAEPVLLQRRHQHRLCFPSALRIEPDAWFAATFLCADCLPSASGVLDLPEQAAILAFDCLGEALQPVRIVASPHLHPWQTCLVTHHAKRFRHRQRRPARCTVGVILD